MRILGIICIALAGCWIGFLKSSKLSEHVAQLQSVKMMLKFIETEIRFNAPPVPVLLEKMCGQSELRTLSFLPICLTQIQRGTDLPHAWEHSLRRVKTTLTGEEIGLLQAFGAQLGTTDINGQISHCHMYDQLLDDKLSAALQKKQELSRMYISLGLFLGLAAAILFI